MALKDDEREVVAVRGGLLLLVNGKPVSLPARIRSTDRISTVLRREWERQHPAAA